MEEDDDENDLDGLRDEDEDDEAQAMDDDDIASNLTETPNPADLGSLKPKKVNRQKLAEEEDVLNPQLNKNLKKQQKQNKKQKTKDIARFKTAMENDESEDDEEVTSNTSSNKKKSGSDSYNFATDYFDNDKTFDDDDIDIDDV